MNKRFILKRRPLPDPQQYELVGSSDYILPRVEDELPFDAITLDGSSGTAVTINSRLPTVIRRD